MPTLPKLTLVILLAAAVPAVAQDNQGKPAAADAPKAEGEQGIVLEEPARTVEEALERLAEHETAAEKEIAAVRKAQEERLAAVKQRTINDLKAIARRAISTGALPEASEAYEEVLNLDPRDKDAADYFRTIGRADIIRKKIAAAASRKNSGQPSDRRLALAGSWKGVWGTDGDPIHFTISPDGSTLTLDGKSHSISEKFERFVIFNEWDRHVELVPANGFLILLGWPRSSGQHPFSSEPSHVARMVLAN